MTKMPKISCIMTTYNSEKYIHDSIDSILAQTYDDFEFIISDWWSNDKTVEIIKEYMKNDKRIILLENAERKNIPCCLNDCIKIAKWEYIAIMESDDKSTKDRFKVELNRLESNVIDIVIPWYKVISENWEKVISTVSYDNSFYKSSSNSDILFDVKLWVVDCMFKKILINKIWLFEEEEGAWDFFFQCKCFMNKRVDWLFIDNFLYLKREAETSYSSNIKFLKEICLARVHLIRKYNICST